jgi:hypothetical protein
MVSPLTNVPAMLVSTTVLPICWRMIAVAPDVPPVSVALAANVPPVWPVKLRRLALSDDGRRPS